MSFAIEAYFPHTFTFDCADNMKCNEMAIKLILRLVGYIFPGFINVENI
jgi:hypothetical protein